MLRFANFHALIFVIFAISSTGEGKILLHSVEGEVSAENFTYWSLTYIGNLILAVNSTEGDVDIYVSESLSKPGYEPSLYDLHSATCGIDIIEIPKSFKRPIGVGLYGHFLHNISKYVLEVYLDTERRYERWDHEGHHQGVTFSEAPKLKTPDKPVADNNSNLRSKLRTVIARSGFWAFLELFEILLF
ncbi:UPF0669 protein v1g209471 [Agrilus planipennis]|uniref:UPF0669 protein v1g209471 n=1 Tax=Agrilus planipennis TaxID=224129 RepID=A0A1W4WXD3_AGRPL|nr:UPF0669 protein v1g209471 [Agrilus planipennis]